MTYYANCEHENAMLQAGRGPSHTPPLVEGCVGTLRLVILLKEEKVFSDIFLTVADKIRRSGQKNGSHLFSAERFQNPKVHNNRFY